MRPKFQFRIGNVLRATAWVAASCAAWSMVLRDASELGAYGRYGPEVFLAALFGLLWLMIGGPILAVAEIFGRTRAVFVHTLFVTAIIFVLLAAFLPAIQ